jgi:hypothetical protein
MRGGRQLAKPDVARPFDGRVRPLQAERTQASADSVAVAHDLSLIETTDGLHCCETMIVQLALFALPLLAEITEFIGIEHLRNEPKRQKEKWAKNQ